MTVSPTARIDADKSGYLDRDEVGTASCTHTHAQTHADNTHTCTMRTQSTMPQVERLCEH